MEIIVRAREFAIHAHSNINHRRKYTKQPYSVHLNAVAKLVATVTDNPNVIAAAWLHDVVEDTSITLTDVETVFGKEISSLVAALTDVSKPGDGNRAARKKIDLDHLAMASPEAQTIKLADLIDNSLDITKNDPRFAKTFLNEMKALLEVLTDGDYALMQRAQKTLESCLKKIRSASPDKTAREEKVGLLYERLSSRSRLIKLIMETFIAHDIAEPLRSFDIGESSSDVFKIMNDFNLNMVCLREQGKSIGYTRLKDLQRNGKCGDHLRSFRPGQILQHDSPLSEAIHALGLHEFVFIEALGDIGGYISRNEANKPEFRMWLFGIITFIEMEITHAIKEKYPDDSWRSILSKSRLQKAEDLQAERHRRGERCSLINCLQLADKGLILLQIDEIVGKFHLSSKMMLKQTLKELESLRNNLAHSQDIGNQNWDLIARLSYNLEYDANIKLNR